MVLVIQVLYFQLQSKQTKGIFSLNTNLSLGDLSRNVYFCLQMVKPLILLISVCSILHNWCSLSFWLGYFCIKLQCEAVCGSESELCKQKLWTCSLPSRDFSRPLRIKAKSNLSFQSVCPSHVSVSQIVGIYIRNFPVTSPQGVSQSILGVLFLNCVITDHC